jgi:hypothetical protein
MYTIVYSGLTNHFLFGWYLCLRLGLWPLFYASGQLTSLRQINHFIVLRITPNESILWKYSLVGLGFVYIYNKTPGLRAVPDIDRYRNHNTNQQHTQYNIRSRTKIYHHIQPLYITFQRPQRTIGQSVTVISL